MRYDPNPRLAEDLASDPEVRRMLQDKADEALNAARADARGRGWSDEFIGTLDASQASLSTSDPTGHLREWGSQNNPAYAPLRKAVERVGARYVDDA